MRKSPFHGVRWAAVGQDQQALVGVVDDLPFVRQIDVGNC